MSYFDEWDVPTLWLDRSNAPVRRAAQKSPAQKIAQQLASASARAPETVHFYQGEGLRWIRLAYGNTVPVGLPTVIDAGKIIETCLSGSDKPLYFHAMRPFDVLFFLPNGEHDALGMDAKAYGAPFADMLAAWTPSPPRKAPSAPATRKRAAAPPSHRSRSKA